MARPEAATPASRAGSPRSQAWRGRSPPSAAPLFNLSTFQLSANRQLAQCSQIRIRRTRAYSWNGLAYMSSRESPLNEVR